MTSHGLAALALLFSCQSLPELTAQASDAGDPCDACWDSCYDASGYVAALICSQECNEVCAAK